MERMARDYHIYLVCPKCFRSRWTLGRQLELTRVEVLNTPWVFDCQEHGLVWATPLHASEKRRIAP